MAKNHGESVHQNSTSHEAGQPKQAEGLRKLAVILALAPLALSGCAAEAQAEPEPKKQEQVVDTPASEPTKTPPEKEVTPDAPAFIKTREWNLNTEQLADLGRQLEAYGGGTAEYPAELYAAACDEFDRDNPLSLDFEQNPLNSPEELLQIRIAQEDRTYAALGENFSKNKLYNDKGAYYVMSGVMTCMFPYENNGAASPQASAFLDNLYGAIEQGADAVPPTAATLEGYTDKFRSADPVVWLKVTLQMSENEPMTVYTAYLFDHEAGRWKIVDEVNAAEKTPEGAMILSPAN